MTIPVVETANLKKTYMLRKVPVSALRRVNLKVESGDFLAVLGPSESGKSTLLNLIGALDKSTEGRMLIEAVGHEKSNSAFGFPMRIGDNWFDGCSYWHSLGLGFSKRGRNSLPRRRHIHGKPSGRDQWDDDNPCFNSNSDHASPSLRRRGQRDLCAPPSLASFKTQTCRSVEI